MRLFKTKFLFTSSIVSLVPASSASILEEIRALKYLGSYLLPSGQAENEVCEPVGMAKLELLPHGRGDKLTLRPGFSSNKLQYDLS